MSSLTGLIMSASALSHRGPVEVRYVVPCLRDPQKYAIALHRRENRRWKLFFGGGHGEQVKDLKISNLKFQI